jgi:hypothetical protein
MTLLPVRRGRLPQHPIGVARLGATPGTQDARSGAVDRA